MAVDYSVARWTAVVPSRQWAREDQALRSIPEAIPDWVLASRPLAEVHRLDLALFVVLEEAALRVSGALVRRAPTPEALAFAAQQTIDEARHLEVFRGRLDQARLAAALDPAGAVDVVLIPPLRQFLARCHEVADSGSFVEGLALMNLVLEGMAFPLYGYEERYWAPVDPVLSLLIRNAYADETRHCALGATLVRGFLDADSALRSRVSALVEESRVALREVFAYYVKVFVSLFDAVAKTHAERFATAECAPGHLIAQTPYGEQVAMIHRSIDEQHTRLLAQAGIQTR